MFFLPPQEYILVGILGFIAVLFTLIFLLHRHLNRNDPELLERRTRMLPAQLRYRAVSEPYPSADGAGNIGQVVFVSEDMRPQ